jgi:hypothetical protein
VGIERRRRLPSTAQKVLGRRAGVAHS